MNSLFAFVQPNNNQNPQKFANQQEQINEKQQNTNSSISTLISLFIYP